MKKKECQEFLDEHGVQYDNNLSTIELKKKVCKYIKENVKLACEEAAENKGHKVLYTPPYHCNFQPIEWLWAKVKGNCGRMYSDGTTLTMCYERLVNQFELAERMVRCNFRNDPKKHGNYRIFLPGVC